MSISEGLLERRGRVVSDLRRHRRIIVALSGGVDSAVLLGLARNALGQSNVLAITGVSESLAQAELEDARRVASELGTDHEIITTHELDRLAYRANEGDRCFHCRSELFELLTTLAEKRGYDAVAYGAIVDDLGDVRPGMEAARRLGVVAPLLEAGIGKSDVRELAQWMSLHIDDKPASPCLASRIPTGTEVTPERLRQIEHAESALRSLGLRLFRVRHHGDIARIEMGEQDFGRILELHASISRAVRSAGFRYVAVDLDGYRAAGAASADPAPVTLYSIAPSRESGQ